MDKQNPTQSTTLPQDSGTLCYKKKKQKFTKTYTWEEFKKIAKLAAK